MRSLRLIRGAAIGFMAAALLGVAGCGSPSGSSQGAGAKTLSVWYSTDDPVERGWAENLATRFNSSHPHVHVHLSVYEFEDINTKLQLALAGGHPPDLAYVTPRGPGIPQYVGHHTLLDLSRAAKAQGWAGKLRKGLLAEYNKPFSHYGASHGTTIAVPTSLAAVGILYNVRLLHRLKLAVPRTLGDFEAALSTAKAAGLVPLGMGNEDGWLGDDWYLTLVNAQMSPAQLQPEQNLKTGFSFHQRAFVSAAETLQRWAKSNFFTTQFAGVDAQEGLDQFFKGHTLFQLVSSSENAQILRDQSSSHLPVGVFAFPRSDGGRTVPMSGYLGWVVPVKGQHHAEAISFINSLLSPSTTRFYLAHGVLPAARTPAEGRLGSALASPTWQRQYVDAVDTARPGPYIDAAPIASLNATMEANVQLLLQNYEAPSFLVKSLQKVYDTHGKSGSTARIDGEF